MAAEVHAVSKWGSSKTERRRAAEAERTRSLVPICPTDSAGFRRTAEVGRSPELNIRQAHRLCLSQGIAVEVAHLRAEEIYGQKEAPSTFGPVIYRHLRHQPTTKLHPHCG